MAFRSFVWLTDETLSYLDGVVEVHLRDRFSDAVTAHGGTNPMMREYRALTVDELNSVGIQKRPDGTCYMVRGTAHRVK